MSARKILKVFVGTYAFGVAGSITFLDNFGYIASVEGRSMQPTLNPLTSKNKDVVFLNRRAVQSYRIERGDIVSLLSPSCPNEVLIKRVIALEGDTIKTLTYKNRYVTVPEGHCWIEGDNQKHSLDSNYFGPVAIGLIVSRASHILWPIDRIQTLKNSLPQNRLVDQNVIEHLNDDEVTGMGAESLDVL